MITMHVSEIPIKLKNAMPTLNTAAARMIYNAREAMLKTENP